MSLDSILVVLVPTSRNVSSGAPPSPLKPSLKLLLKVVLCPIVIHSKCQ